MNNLQEKPSALEPYRVLDLTEDGCMIGARMLGDLGADVIKIEPPGGSPSRRAPFHRDTQDPGKSLFWFAYNANKRGVTLDITSSEGQEILKALTKTADIVIESFEVGYMDRLALGYAELSKIKPDIIMASITPFGQSGPKSKYKGCDLTTWASSGFLSICGSPERAPNWISFPQALLYGGAEAAAGVMCALWHRQMTGEGQHVDVSMQECFLSPHFNVLQMWDVNKINTRRLAGNTYIPATGVMQKTYYQCQDGYVMILVQGGAEPQVSSTKRLVEWMDEEGMAEDWLKEVDWVNEYNAATLRQEFAEKVEAEVEKFTRTKTKMELYEEGGVNRRILLAPVSNARDICENKQLKSREYWMDLEHPELDETLTYCGAFLKISGTPVAYRRRAPLIGEHNDEIYLGELGLSAERLKSLQKSGII
jgi:crotonobetainyl-CoA:carnitine CoA-transferase CaiB-like acyl-CoA transferase